MIPSKIVQNEVLGHIPACDRLTGGAWDRATGGFETSRKRQDSVL